MVVDPNTGMESRRRVADWDCGMEVGDEFQPAVKKAKTDQMGFTNNVNSSAPSPFAFGNNSTNQAAGDMVKTVTPVVEDSQMMDVESGEGAQKTQSSCSSVSMNSVPEAPSDDTCKIGRQAVPIHHTGYCNSSTRFLFF